MNVHQDSHQDSPAAAAPADVRTLLTVTGQDRPGITSALFGAMAQAGADIVDVELVVVCGRLVLGVVVSCGDRTPLAVAAAERVCAELGLAVESGPVDDEGAVPTRRAPRHHVTLIAPVISAEAIATVARTVAGCGGNIERITRLADYPVASVELLVAGPGSDALRTALAAAAGAAGVDIGVERSGLLRRAKRLVVFDVDSTLIQDEVIELLAEHAGCAAEVAAVTASAMEGRLDFEESLRARVALLAGLDERVLDDVRERIRLTPGARTLLRTLKRLGYRVGMVSGGFTQLTDSLAAELGMDFAAANTLEIVDGRLTGRVVGPVVDRAYKAAALQRFAEEAGVSLAQTVAVGDGANDIDMLRTAGLGIAFNAKPALLAVADTSISVPYLDTVLFLLGVRREEIDDADAAD